MNRYNNFIDKLKSGSCMIINGATGTEIEKRGVPQLSNAWNGGGALSRPDILLHVYKDSLDLFPNLPSQQLDRHWRFDDISALLL